QTATFCPIMHKGLFILTAILGILSLGALVNSKDNYRREFIKLKESDGQRYITGLIVAPRAVDYPPPVVVYVHGSGGQSISDGPVLRGFADLGLIAVSFDYDENDPERFCGTFTQLLEFIRERTRIDTNAIGWVGVGQGAQCTLSCLLRPT